MKGTFKLHLSHGDVLDLIKKHVEAEGYTPMTIELVVSNGPLPNRAATTGASCTGAVVHITGLPAKRGEE